MKTSFVVIALVLLLLPATTAGQSDDAYDQLRGGNTTTNESETTYREPESPPQPGPGPTRSDVPTSPTNRTNRLDADIWATTWHRRIANIYRVDPDGLRDRPGKVSRMFTNFTVHAYVKDPAPFEYQVYVSGGLVHSGVSTWKLEYTTQVPERVFNLTVKVKQHGQVAEAEWQHIISTKKDSGGLYEEEGEEVGEGETVTFTKSEWSLKMFLFFAASAGVMVATFAFVGGVHLEKMQRLGWSRWMG